MDDEIRISVSLPLDADGFLRRECPVCEHEFKWFSHDERYPEAEPVEQYFCPLCGAAAGVDEWWTPAQLEFAQGSAGPDLDRVVQDAVADAFKGIKGVTIKPGRDLTLDIPTPEPLSEPNDMVIVEPPCHPNEPVKVPESATDRIYCLICGSPFTA